MAEFVIRADRDTLIPKEAARFRIRDGALVLYNEADRAVYALAHGHWTGIFRKEVSAPQEDILS
jgi:hypothetical protein